MSIISKESFEKLTKEEKQKLRDVYSILDKNNSEARIAEEYELIFGQENLQMLPNIRTWKDMQKYKDFLYTEEEMNKLTSLCFIKTEYKNKIIATYKLYKIIKLGYGGIPNEEQCKEDGAWQIIPYRDSYDKDFKLKIVYDFKTLSFVSFYEQEQAEMFMSYSENVELVKDYFVLA